MSYPNLSVTRGKFGATHYEDHSTFLVLNTHLTYPTLVSLDDDEELYDLIYVLTEAKNKAFPIWEYGFVADGGSVTTSAYGGLVKFDSYESAKHTGDKCYSHELKIMRRIKGSNDEWVEAPEPENQP